MHYLLGLVSYPAIVSPILGRPEFDLRLEIAGPDGQECCSVDRRSWNKIIDRLRSSDRQFEAHLFAFGLSGRELARLRECGRPDVSIEECSAEGKSLIIVMTALAIPRALSHPPPVPIWLSAIRRNSSLSMFCSGSHCICNGALVEQRIQRNDSVRDEH
jgi:hypothetical protein